MGRARSACHIRLSPVNRGLFHVVYEAGVRVAEAYNRRVENGFRWRSHSMRLPVLSVLVACITFIAAPRGLSQQQNTQP
jgi:hypothetical protein